MVQREYINLRKATLVVIGMVQHPLGLPTKKKRKTSKGKAR
jgi:hypothetical protein